MDEYEDMARGAKVAQLGSSFGGAAADYAEHRPDYPDAAIAWALEPVVPAARIVDLAAGTGKLTAGLVGAGSSLVAVEPDAAMLAELPERLAARVCAGAEEIPLRSGCADAVVVGQAFHWFDADRALGEIARVLRPGGVLAAFWNYFDDSVAWVRAFDELISSARWWARQDRGSSVPAHPAFAEPERHRFAHAHRRTAGSLIRTAGTHSRLRVMDEAERAATLGEIRDLLAGHEETADGEFDLPIITTAVRTLRR